MDNSTDLQYTMRWPKLRLSAVKYKMFSTGRVDENIF